MSRTLASVQRITDIQPIEGADAIECASVLGWKVVVKKGEYRVGDLAVYFEIDSVPPDEPEYRFLWRNADQRPNNFRIKTIKLRGQISQGILFQLTGVHKCLIPWFLGTEEESIMYPPEGVDLTDHLGVTKYEPPLPGGGTEIVGQFFDGVPKTDEERVQSSTGAKHLAALQGRPYYITVKCDGASMTVAMHEGIPKVASRNYRLAELPDSHYWRAAWNDNLIEFIRAYPELAVQGELCGPGIQNNRLGLTNHHCFVFNIYDRDHGVWLSRVEMEEVTAGWGGTWSLVPLVEEGLSFNYDQDDLLVLAEGKYEGTKSEREGIVIRNNDGGERISFKAISNRFLLKGGD